MSVTMKTIAANAAAGGMGAVLGTMHGSSWQVWALLFASVIITTIPGQFYVASEVKGRKFWSSLALKIVIGFVAALQVDGNLKILMPILLTISVADPKLVIAAGRKVGLIGNLDEKEKP